MNLKFQLTLNIALVGILCLLCTTLYVFYRAELETRRATRLTADSVKKHLEFQLIRINAGLDNPNRFPDLNFWKETHATPGTCVEFTTPDRRFKQTVCHGAELTIDTWPKWFEKFYRLKFDPGHIVTRAIKYKRTIQGKLRVIPSARMELSGTWEILLAMIKLSGITIFGICLLMYFVIGRILRPARMLVSALEKMRDGDLHARVPKFRIPEWQRTGCAINDLATAQQELLRERSRLSLKLVSQQEKERGHLARELHNETGQCMAASNAVATSILETAKTEYPVLVPEAESILRINRTMLDAVNAMVKRLLPADLDELGLSTCLKSLISEWNTRTKGRIRYRLVLDGPCDELPEPLPVTLFRIVQECLSNIAKHSNAANVSVVLEVDTDSLDLLVENDGHPIKPELPGKTGPGLTGIRERVAALDGHLRIESPQSGGFLVHAIIPFQAIGKTEQSMHKD